MTEHPSEETELAWPERWSDAADGPPLARAFLKQIERFEAAPVAAASRSSSRVSLAVAASIVALAALGALYFWSHGRETPGESLALVPVSDPLPLPPPPALPPLPAPTPSTGVGAAVVAPDNTDDEPSISPATRVEMGRLFVSTTPPTAMAVDGVGRGRTPLRLRLTPGPHLVRWTDPEHGIDVTETIEIVSGDTAYVSRRFDVPPPRVDPSPPSASADDRYDTARACAISGDYGCVIETLRGHCTTAREFELLISSMRSSSGYERDIESNMRTYLSRFPAGRTAGTYRYYLVTH